MLHALRIALATLLLLSGASAVEFGPRRVLLAGNVPTWVLRSGGVLPTVDCPFGSGGGPISSCWVNGTGIVPLSSLLSISRASNETYTDASGNLSFIGSNVLANGSAGLQGWEARTNLILQSQNYGTTWVKNTSAIASGITAPDGTATAYHLTSTTTGTATVFLSQSLSYSNTTAYTIFEIMKAAENSFAWIDSFTGTSDFGVLFNLSTGAVVGNRTGGGAITSSGMIPLVSGWYICYFTFTSNGTGGSFGAQLGTQTNNTLTFNSGTQVSGNGIDIWQYQHEAGAFPTPAIPTTTTSVTRAADNITATGALATVLALPMASLIVKTNTSQQSLAGTLIDANGTVLLGKNASNNGTTAVGATLNSSNTGTWTGANDLGLAWDGTGGVIDLNGTTATDATARTPVAPFHVGSTSGSASFWNGNITRLTAFSSKLGAPQ